MRTRIQPDSRGIALIIVMLAITVLSILIAIFAKQMKVETKLAQNANSETELLWLGRSGVELARYVLGQQLAIGGEPYDSLNQKWAGGPGGSATSNSVLSGISLENYQLGDGKFSVKITDLERKANINIADEAMLQQVLLRMGVDASDYSTIVGSILDWISPNKDIHHIGGAGSDYYQNLNPPYYAKNAPIDDLSELLLVKGVTPEIYWGGTSSNHPPASFQQKLGRFDPNAPPPSYPFGLADVFTPISNGKININTASATVLQILPFVDEHTASEIIRQRSGPDGVDGTEDDTPFGNVGELVNVMSPQLVPQMQRICSVRSSTFEVQVNAEVGGYTRKFIAILARKSPKDVQILSFYWK